jgi:DNA-binding transcriptional MerR regulator
MSRAELSAEDERNLPAGWLPIREVTLRAWERRYGLVVPHRTAKGHRLFDDGDVQRIQQIVAWLNRGVAVSQVKALLDSPTRAPTPVAENDWQPLRQQLLAAIEALNERRIDELFNQAMALYPAVTLCEQLWLPLLDGLDLRWQGQFGARMERTFFFSWMRSKLGARIYHNNRRLHGAPLLLINQSDLVLDPHLWLTAWLASSAGCPVEVFDWPLPPGELGLACERLNARGVLLYASKALDLGQLPRLLGNCQCSKLIAGAAVRIHHSQWPAQLSTIAGLSLADSPLSAHASLQQQGLLHETLA